jgi:hypothetical protein
VRRGDQRRKLGLIQRTDLSNRDVTACVALKPDFLSVWEHGRTDHDQRSRLTYRANLWRFLIHRFESLGNELRGLNALSL